MNTSRLWRALDDELYWLGNGVISIGAVVALLLKSPLTLGLALLCGAAVLVLLFLAQLWEPTAVLAVVAAGLIFTAEAAVLGLAVAARFSAETHLTLGAGAVSGALLGAWVAWSQGREVLGTRAAAQLAEQGRRSRPV